MTRGRPPVKAVKEAIEIAKSRGGVWEVPETAGLPFDFIIFPAFCTVFVKVRRTRSNVSAPQEILQYCSAAIREFRTLPQSAVAAWELWALSPHGTWQFFLITADAIREIRSDGTIIAWTGQDTPDQHLTPVTGSGVISPGQGLLPTLPGSPICPYLSRLQGKT